jgi:hypothetical protein
MTVIERSLPSGLGSTVKALEQLVNGPVDTADGLASLVFVHRLRPRGFGMKAVVTCQLVESGETLTLDVTMAEAPDGTSVVQLATRGACRDGFDTAHAVLHDLTLALDALLTHPPWSSMRDTANC